MVDRTRLAALGTSLRSPTGIIVATALLLVLSRGALIATSTATVEPITPVIAQQLELSQDLCGASSEVRRKVRYFFLNLRNYLPPAREFHGVLLLNTLVLLPLGCILGPRPLLAELLALAYTLGAFALWASFLRRYGNRRALLAFSVLFLLAPPQLVTYSMYLLGSHVEGTALVALVFWMALVARRPVWRSVLFLSVGPLFFLYKGTVFPFLLVLPPAFVLLRGWSERGRALGLLALGHLPVLGLALVWGYRGTQLEDAHGYAAGVASEDLITWWNVFTGSLRTEALVSPLAELLAPPEGGLMAGPVYVGLFAACFAGVAIRLVLRARRGEAGSGPLRVPKGLAWCTVLAYPLIHVGAISLSRLPIEARFYLPLFPVMVVVIAAAIGGLPRWLGLTAVGLVGCVMLHGSVLLWFG